VNKKESILKAALELLVVNGIHATPMSAIAKAANTGMGTIYNYFPTKEILINAIYIDIKQKEKALLLSPISKETIKEEFEHYYIVVINFFLKNPVYFQFLEQLNSSPIISEESKREGYKAIEPVITLLKKGQKEGVIKDIDIEELLQFLGGAIFSNLRWLFHTTNLKTISTSNQLKLVWDALKL